MKIFLALVLLAGPVFAQDQVWTWVDEKGEEHYTNDRSAIPEKFRTRVKSTEGQELSILKTHEDRAALEPARAPSSPIRVVLFEASTNSASKTLSRSGVVDKLVSNNPGLKLERLEFATSVERAERLKVTQLPTVLFVDNADAVIARSVGLVTLKELQQLLDKARGVE